MTRSPRRRRGLTLLTMTMVVVLVGLGSWQLARLHWKQELIATMESRLHLPPLDVATLPAGEDFDYRPATATGLFRHHSSFFLLSIGRNGQGGYHVLTPLALADGRTLLVDRGWIPYDRRTEPGMFRPAGMVTVSGILRRPQHHWNQPANDPERNDWYGVDLDAMARLAGIADFLPLVLEADATPNPEGYPIGGQTRLSLPNNHLGYAVTWYGLALALLIIHRRALAEKTAAA